MCKSLIAAVLLAAGTLLAANAQQTPAASNQTAPAATTPQAPAKGAGAAADSVSPFASRKEKFSYALGMNIGTGYSQGLKKQGVEVDWNLVVQGLKDSAMGPKTLLTEEQAKAVLNEVQNELRQQQKEKADQAAAANKADGEAFLTANKDKPGVKTLPDGLQYKVITEGTGPKPTAADTVVCNYRGTTITGTEFDSSQKHGQAATFPVGGVIKGWTEALLLMPVGSKWQLFIPPSLAYGDRPPPGADFGPNATLIFEVELLSIQDKSKTPQDQDIKKRQ